MSIEGGSVYSGRVGRRPLTLDAAGVAGDGAVALVHLLAIWTRHRLQDNQIYS